MSKTFDIPVWKKAPFIRLLLPLIAGILLEWYLQISVAACLTGAVCFSIAYGLFFLFPVAVQFKLQSLQAVILNLLIVCFGLLVTWQKDIQHNNSWFGQYYQDNDYLVVRINEPLVEKSKSYKADGYVEALIHHDTLVKAEGKVLLYFAKDSLPAGLHYGDKIIIGKKLQTIKNSGNPGAFNYQRYAAFQSVFHNVFLQPKDWVKLNEKNINVFKRFIFSSRAAILSVLQKNISAGKDELGIAEALLIGYTNDLDKDLVQAYSNTGVVHIIAISGMHLALIYGLLVWLFAKIPLINKSKITQVILILACLWIFSLLTGAAASVLRSAVMFTFIAVGKKLSRQSSVYNSLAGSALVMLCYNPYFLWDVGFQLSYLAVVGIIIFQKSIYNWLYIKNKLFNEIWKLMAISLAAQVLTFPICIYYFHQFPNLFLITNIVAVPLSGLILFVEIGLVAFSWVPFAGNCLGILAGWMVWLMNSIISTVSQISFAVWDNLPSSIASTWLLYTVVIGIGVWLLNQNKTAFRLAIICLLAFVTLQAWENWQIKQQQQLIVYNVPQHQAIDFIAGNEYRFVGDSVLLEDGVLQNFHLKPARIALQLQKRTDSMPMIFQEQQFYQFGAKKILVIDKPIWFEQGKQKIDVDFIIISKNPSISLPRLAAVFNCGKYIFDASNSFWKINQWQQDCIDLHLDYYSIPANGAYVCNIKI
jgi:competence protein ComEC